MFCMMWSCRTPDRYELIVVALSLRARASQSMKIRICLLPNGISMHWPVSFAHFNSMIWAVLYEFQVLWAIPRLPKFASESAVSFGNSRCAKNLLEQPLVVPYFLLPLDGVGLKQEVCAVSCGIKRRVTEVQSTYK